MMLKFLKSDFFTLVVADKGRTGMQVGASYRSSLTTLLITIINIYKIRDITYTFYNTLIVVLLLYIFF